MANFDQKSLKALKKQLAQRQKAEKSAAEAATQQQREQQQDATFFQNAMADVKPLAHNNTVHHAPTPKTPRAPRNHTDEPREIIDPLSDAREVTEVEGEQALSFCRDGIQRSVFRKLRSGGYRISDELDLHGANTQQAKQLLVAFLQQAVQFEGCCVRVVHGKGQRSSGQKAVLKTHVNHWLQEHERVLAFHSTKPRDGGNGALYVLLKREYEGH